MEPRPIHIAGHGRSGTSILSQLFNGKGYVVAFERSAKELGVFGKPGAPVERPHQWRAWAAKQQKAGRLVDKDPRNLLRLAEVCEATGGLGLHILRDGRDVACSVHAALAKRKLGLRQWLAKRTSDSAPGLVNVEEAEALARVAPKVAVGAFWARLVTEAIRRHGGHPAIQLVRYEELVHHPRDVALVMAEHLGVNPGWLSKRATERMRNDPRLNTAAGSAGLHVVGNRTCRTGRWLQQFTPEESKALRWLAGEEYEALGYGWDDAPGT